MRSIDEGERLAARPELARVYREVGQRMSTAGGEAEGMNGLSPAVFLEKARALFTELRLDWDRSHLGAAGLRAAQ